MYISCFWLFIGRNGNYVSGAVYFYRGRFGGYNFIWIDLSGVYFFRVVIWVILVKQITSELCRLCTLFLGGMDVFLIGFYGCGHFLIVFRGWTFFWTSLRGCGGGKSRKHPPTSYQWTFPCHLNKALLYSW